jgi:hypothetical protein
MSLIPSARLVTFPISSSGGFDVPLAAHSNGDGMILTAGASDASFTTSPASYGWTYLGYNIWWKIADNDSSPIPCQVSPGTVLGFSISYTFAKSDIDWIDPVVPQLSSMYLHNYSNDFYVGPKQDGFTPDLHGGDTCWIYFGWSLGGSLQFNPVDTFYNVSVASRQMACEAYGTGDDLAVPYTNKWSFTNEPYGRTWALVVPGPKAGGGGGFGALGL